MWGYISVFGSVLLATGSGANAYHRRGTLSISGICNLTNTPQIAHVCLQHSVISMFGINLSSQRACILERPCSTTAIRSTDTIGTTLSPLSPTR